MKAKLLTLAALSLAACAGTGTRDGGEINKMIEQADGSTVLVSRSTGFTGSAARIFVVMDGEQVAALGNNEVATFQAPPGEHTLELRYEGPAGLTTQSNKLTYTEDPARPQFFTVSQKQQFVGAKITITEVAASSFGATLR